MPHADVVTSTWRRLQEDGHVPAGLEPLFVRAAHAQLAQANATATAALAAELQRTEALLAAAVPARVAAGSTRPPAPAPAPAPAPKPSPAPAPTPAPTPEPPVRFHKPFGWQLCDAYPASVAALFADAAQELPNPDFVVLTGDW